jgi:hypothetical protein
MTPLNLQHELDRRLSKAQTADEKIKVLELILRRLLSQLEGRS